ncbi:hypothetical protein CcI156_15015 [Frankia sp. CcI156]|jgi:LmbE family N-acetylglucosaminyl deacetylase|uniref:LmbE-like protein n=1 Tax=Frankia casuarinae (strain DSM 45818 / CECT 9043 / HFP020203 / CcI3) TaxID=106370 RepID=Q2J7M0_FRACC|nr:MULTISPECIES: PIG-L family deacetylase [Frankia]ABD12722.1 hypothetical protein Francci3_3367 [Frankia casuarinae]ETA00470.1 putative LmbE-like protein [Frankia sp. CcI6]EYT91013.1 putative LmbE-like protein [Frankia casuarinae]OAA20298.1 GlcNAc-PI de-N-acetylase [Frankia casuarinae]OHV49231.1 hypothetical protein CgIS1_21420 [Frankia sp. CgIS1]
MGSTVLLVSPHPDDLAWSVGATVATLAGAGHDLHAVTVFGRSRYAPGSAAHGDAASVTALRTAEDAAWADRHAGAALVSLRLPDASLRGYTDDTEMGAAADPGLVRRVADGLAALAAAVRPRFLLAPMAVGGHVDHEVVRRAVDAVAPCLVPEPSVVWYADLPYAAATGPAPTRAGTLVAAGPYRRAIERGVLYYPSQLPGEHLPVLHRYLAAEGGERLRTDEPWATEALANLLGRADLSDTRFGAQR